MVCRDQDAVKRVRRERRTSKYKQSICTFSVSQCVHGVKMDSRMPQGLPVESCKNSSPLFLFFPTLNPLISLSHPRPSFILSSVWPLPSSSLSFLIFHSFAFALLVTCANTGITRPANGTLVPPERVFEPGRGKEFGSARTERMGWGVNMWESFHPVAGVEDSRTAGLVGEEKWKHWWSVV